jgi:hypothetical protein
MTTYNDVIEQLRLDRPKGMYPGLVLDKPKKESVELQVWLDMRDTNYTGVESKTGKVDPMLRIDFEVGYHAEFDNSTHWLWNQLLMQRDADLASGDVPGVENVRLRDES